MLNRYVHRMIVLALVWSAGLSYVQAQSGYCGDRILSNGNIISDSPNVTWTLYSDSLAFVGEGAMGTTQSGANSQANYIKKVSFSKDITFIGRYALSYMNKLEKITVDPENANYISPDNCNCLIEKANENDTNILLAIGNGYIPEGVEVLRNYALCDNYRLTSITIPRSVRQMGEKTPRQDVGYDESPFQLSSLKEIHVQWTSEEELPVWIAKKEIKNASNITLYVPCGTKSIYQNAAPWNTCKKIVDGSGTCGSNLTWSICDSVLTISGTGEMTNWSNTTSSVPWYGYRNEIKHVVIEEGVTTIGNYAFYQMSKIKTVTNPSTLKIIGTFAFHSCYGLESINLPDGLTSIGRNTTGHGPFYGCHSLKTLYIPASVTMINKDAFLRCYSLTSIVVDPANPIYDSRDNCNAIIETAQKKLWYGCSTSVIPDGVVTVADYAFEYQHNLKSIRISNTVKFFGTTVFKECENLKDIYVEWTSSIPNYKLTDWSEHSKANIGIDLDSTITVHVPCGCKTNYQSLLLYNWKSNGKDKYKIVDNHQKGGICGANGSNLTWMLDCSGVLTISGKGEMADYSSASDSKLPWKDYKTSINSIIIEDGVTKIGTYAFANCSNLTSVTIPTSMKTLAKYAFSNCTNLTSVTIPSSVSSLGQNLFYSSGITDLYLEWTENIPDWPNQFTTNFSPTLHVPCEAIHLYKTTNGWKDYNPNIVGAGTFTITVLADPTMGIVSIE